MGVVEESRVSSMSCFFYKEALAGSQEGAPTMDTSCKEIYAMNKEKVSGDIEQKVLEARK